MTPQNAIPETCYIAPMEEPVSVGEHQHYSRCLKEAYARLKELGRPLPSTLRQKWKELGILKVSTNNPKLLSCPAMSSSSLPEECP